MGCTALMREQNGRETRQCDPAQLHTAKVVLSFSCSFCLKGAHARPYPFTFLSAGRHFGVSAPTTIFLCVRHVRPRSVPAAHSRRDPTHLSILRQTDN